MLSVLLCATVMAHAADAKPAAKKPDEKVAPGRKQEMTYDVYAGGFRVVSAQLSVDLSAKDKYELRLSAGTYGMLGKLAPWKGAFQTDGWYAAKTKDAKPEKHFSDTMWRDEREFTEFMYNKDGSFREYRITNAEHKGAEEKDPKLTQGTTDVLTATLQVMNAVAGGKPCEGSNDIFDGERRYALVFKDQGLETLTKTKLNVYDGEAASCTVEVKPVAGKWHEKPRGWMSIQEQGRERGTMPTVWLAKIGGDGPAVPVKIRVKTAYGTLFMHLRSWTDGTKTVKSGK